MTLMQIVTKCSQKKNKIIKPFLSKKLAKSYFFSFNPNFLREDFVTTVAY